MSVLFFLFAKKKSLLSDLSLTLYTPFTFLIVRVKAYRTGNEGIWPMHAEGSAVQLARKFHLRAVKAVVVKRGVYRLYGKEGGQYCLKKMSYPSRRLKWMDGVLLALRRKGMRTFAWRDPRTEAGKTLLVRPNPQSSPYILTPWLRGRSPDPTSEQDMYACGQALARFHRAGAAIDIPSRGAENLLGQWPKLVQARKAFLERRILQAKNSRSPSKMDALLRTHGDHVLQRAAQTLQTFRKSDYFKLCKSAKRNRAFLCHADSGPKNFVITNDGPALIDFESLRIDLRVYDLYRLIRLAGKKNGWSFPIARAALDGYRSVAGLKPIEYELLAAWLGFPQKTFRTLVKYGRARKSERAGLSNKLERVLQNEQRIPAMLRQLSDYAARG